VEVHALVALQPDQASADRARERLGRLGLTDARLALEQQRLFQLRGEEDGGRERTIGQVALL
jgi:hypothetical protein